MNHAIRERKEKGNEKEKRKGTRGRERQEEEEEEKEKEEGKEEEKEKEQVAFVKGFSFFSWLQDQLRKKFAANVNTENKPTKVNRTLSWPSASEICGKVVFLARAL